MWKLQLPPISQEEVGTKFSIGGTEWVQIKYRIFACTFSTSNDSIWDVVDAASILLSRHEGESTQFKKRGSGPFRMANVSNDDGDPGLLRSPIF